MIEVKKDEGRSDENAYYMVVPALAESGRLDDAKPYTLCLMLDRLGNPHLWPIRDPRSEDRDNAWWVSAREGVRSCIDHWHRIMSAGKRYRALPAEDPDYAPDPDWSKVPPFDELVRSAFSPNGIIRDLEHPVVRELLGRKQRGV
jgi:hypothetical protein